MSKWISVKEALPNNNEIVLLVYDKRTFSGYYDFLGKNFYIFHTPNLTSDCISQIYFISRVTHWMPFPEPPKENKDE